MEENKKIVNEITTKKLNTHKQNQLNDMKVNNDYTREDEAHGLGPNPQAYLFETRLVRQSLNTHFISKDSLITSI